MKRILVPLIIFFLVAACSLLGNAMPSLGGPSPKSQQETQDAFNAIQNTQQADIQTQVAMGMTEAAKNQPAPQPDGQQVPAPDQGQGNADQTSIAKTAAVGEMLTSIALTPTATLNAEQLATPKPELKPKASDGTDFTDATFYAWGQWDTQTYGITIELKGTVGGNGGKNFSMKVDDITMTKCFSPLEFPNRLQCVGKPFKGGKRLIQIFETVSGQEQLLFAQRYTFPTWTSTPTKKASKTPNTDNN